MLADCDVREEDRGLFPQKRETPGRQLQLRIRIRKRQDRRGGGGWMAATRPVIKVLFSPA